MGCFSDAESYQQARDMWTSRQRTYLLNPMVRHAGLDNRDAFTEGVNPYSYAGSYSAETTPQMQQYMGQAGNIAQGFGNIANSQAPLDALYDYGARYANDVVTPQVMERFAGLGASDSGGAMQGLTRELGNYGLGLNAQMANTALQNQAQQMQALGGQADVLSGAGMASQDLSQQQLYGDVQSWMDRYNPYRSSSWQQGMGLLGLNTGSGLTSQGAGMGYNAFGSPQAAGGAIGAIASMFSDERLKENVEELTGCLDMLNAIAPKTYNFKEQDPDVRLAGVMAQDVEKVFPEAVIDVSGVKKVDLYALIAMLIGAVRELRKKIHG